MSSFIFRAHIHTTLKILLYFLQNYAQDIRREGLSWARLIVDTNSCICLT